MNSTIHLSDFGILKSGAKTNEIFANIESNFMTNKEKPSTYVDKLWKKYKVLSKGNQSNAMNGQIFEAIITTLLLKEGIQPIYTQANLEFVPNINYDIILFPKNKAGTVDVSAPVILSLKTSLRERYKQADLEGIALKEVYKRALSYLITLDDKNELEKFNKKIKAKDIRGIDACLNATSSDFDSLINNFKITGVSEPPAIKAIKKSHLIP